MARLPFRSRITQVSAPAAPVEPPTATRPARLMTSSMRSGEAGGGSRARAPPHPRASPVDDVEHALGRGGPGNPRRASLAQDADHGRLLFDHGHNDLRLHPAVLEGSDNGVLPVRR